MVVIFYHVRRIDTHCHKLGKVFKTWGLQLGNFGTVFSVIKLITFHLNYVTQAI